MTSQSPLIAVSVPPSRWWIFGVFCAKSWLVIDLCYFSWFMSNSLAILAGLAPTRTSLIDHFIGSTRNVNYAVVHVIVLMRRGYFRDMTFNLVTGHLHRAGERKATKKRILACLSCLLFVLSVLLALNFAEAVFAFKVVDFLYELVDGFTFGHAETMGKFGCRTVLLVDNFLYTAFGGSMVALWFLFALFALTISAGLKSLREDINRVPLLTDAVLKELHDTFQGIQGSIEKVNYMFSPLLFLWYFDALLSSFHGILYFVKGSLGAFSPVYAAFNYFASSAAVLGLTFVASKIPINVEDARRALMDRARNSSFDHLHLQLYLLNKRMSDGRNGLTAAGFFPINRSICLSFVGFLVTYLIILNSSGVNLIA